MSNRTTIGITDSRKYDDYSRWIAEASPEIDIICLSYKFDNLDLVVGCDGIILTGGHDIHPALYNKSEYLDMLDPEQIDAERDAFEIKVIKTALGMKKSLLGICRGLQLTNIYFGGTLIPDIPTIKGLNGHGKIDGQDQLHEIEVREGSLVSAITTLQKGTINSAHHQSAGVIGSGLVATAFSDGDIVEAMEWEHPENKSWLLLVQWHPERISDNYHFSKLVRKAFLESCGFSSS